MYTFQFQMGYKIGDVYYENGIAAGMVWWLADTIAVANGVAYGEHGKLISLTEPVSAFPGWGGLLWGVASKNVRVPAYDTLDGRINTPIIIHIRDSLANDPNTIYSAWRFQAASWCVDSLGGDWYLPALHELRTIFSLIDATLNPALEKISGVKELGTKYSRYWSSTANETDNERAYVMEWGVYPFCFSRTEDQSVPSFVRAVRWF
jgi:hypothetical protein